MFIFPALNFRMLESPVVGKSGCGHFPPLPEVGRLWGRRGAISSLIGNLSPEWEAAQSHQALISRSRRPERSPAQSFTPKGRSEYEAGGEGHP